MLKMDPSASLGILTAQTGGLLIQNTNDLERGIGQINDDRRNYYALTYTPTNAVLDGTYRRIEVKVKRPGVDVRARSGYLAVPANEASPVLTFESPGAGRHRRHAAAQRVCRAIARVQRADAGPSRPHGDRRRHSPARR